MFGIFRKYPNIILTISEKKDGAMKFSAENRQRFLGRLGINDKLIVRADLVHEDNVHPVKFASQLFNRVKIVSNQDAGEVIEKTDGLITGDRNLFLTITVADCLPIFIFDPEKEIIGLVHGGWKNLAGNILEKTIKKTIDNFGSSSKNILVGIGPGISQCHFEVKEDSLREFGILGCGRPLQKSSDRTIFATSPFIDAFLEKDGKYFLDLKKITKTQLINLGMKEENIENSPECTFCLPNKYFSFRRDKARKIQTMLALIGQK